ncbi:unnamed protein product [Caretta caretta]
MEGALGQFRTKFVIQRLHLKVSLNSHTFVREGEWTTVVLGQRTISHQQQRSFGMSLKVSNQESMEY